MCVHLQCSYSSKFKKYTIPPYKLLWLHLNDAIFFIIIIFMMKQFFLIGERMSLTLFSVNSLQRSPGKNQTLTYTLICNFVYL